MENHILELVTLKTKAIIRVTENTYSGFCSFQNSCA